MVVHSLATGKMTPPPLPAPASTASPEVPNEPQNTAAPENHDAAEKGGAVAADAGKEGHGNQKNNFIFRILYDYPGFLVGLAAFQFHYLLTSDYLEEFKWT